MNALLTAAEQLALQNDLFRSQLGMCPLPGTIVQTCGIAALPVSVQEAIFRAVAEFEAFTPDNDPYGEHDFGSVDINGQRVFWKIDLYADRSCDRGSEHPADPARCYRVLTIMLAQEY